VNGLNPWLTHRNVLRGDGVQSDSTYQENQGMKQSNRKKKRLKVSFRPEPYIEESIVVKYG
jgi:hypothetical protein